jgi:hypothetical protein
MKLDPHEAQTTVWIKVRDHIEARIAELRTKNDGHLDPTETAELRGRIAQLKELRALGVQPEHVSSDFDV